MMTIENFRHIYFVGIGGIGMSALARYFKTLGMKVSGYDKTTSELTQQLENEGMQIHYTDSVELIPEDIDCVVYTPAIPNDQKELSYLKSTGLKVYKRAEILGMISKEKKTIGVAGTHGKTTTSAILTHILRSANIECSAFLGGISNDLSSNFVFGQGEWAIMEADEFDRSFLQLEPEISILTSMDADHLDIYKDTAKLQQSFVEYAQKVKRLLVYESGLQIKDQIEVKSISYGTNEADCIISNVHVAFPYQSFDLSYQDQQMDSIEFTMFGIHNVKNATAACMIALDLGVSEMQIRNALKTFKGIKRRLEMVCKHDKITYIDDYAHHPSELTAAIDAVRNIFPNKKITGIFQPHLYSRTQDFSEGFAEALDKLDRIILLEIYPARELPIAGVSSALILDQMYNRNKTLVKMEQLIEHLKPQTETEVLVTLGAGDIGTMVQPIQQMINEHWIKN